MNQMIQELLDKHRHDRQLRRRCLGVFLALALLVTGGVVWQLRQPGATLSGDLICQLEEHQHSEACYEAVLVCGLEESEDQVIPGHHHTEECYETQQICACQLEEHTHGDACYDEAGNLICTQSEHVHTDSCYTQETVLICELEEGEDQVIPGHHHTEDCYENQLVCGKEEHTHTSECLAQPEGTDPQPPTEGSEAEGAQNNQGSSDGSGQGDSSDGSGQDGNTTPEPDDGAGDSSGGEASEPEGNTDALIPQSPDSSASAYKLEGVSARRSLRSAAAPQATGTDFGPYITSVSVSKAVDGQWVDSTEFQVGDSVRVSIHYTLPNDTVTLDNPTIYYQMPDGIHLAQGTQGNVSGTQGTAVGTYTITSDGYIQITFFEQFISDGEAFAGTISFSGSIAAGSSGGDYEINFGGSGGTITVKPNPEILALDIDKSVTNDTVDTLNYTVTISSDLGTNNSIRLADWFAQVQGATVAYQDGSLEIVKHSADGTQTPVSTPSISAGTSQDGYPYFAISDLPALGAGESYVLTYQVNCVPQAGTAGFDILLNNIVQAQITGETDYVQADCLLTLSGTILEKTGLYDANTDTITWRVKINEARQNLKGLTLDDTLTAGSQQIHVDYVDLYAYGTVYKDVPLPFTFQNDFKDPFELVYTIENASQKLNVDSVSNTVTLGTYQDTFDVDITGEGYGLIKTALTQGAPEEIEDNPNYGSISWRAAISVPQDAEALTYTDQLATLNFDGILDLPDFHVTSVYVLLDSLKIQTQEGNELYYTRFWGSDTAPYSDYDILVNGTSITELDQSSFGNPITEFEIQFTEYGLDKIRGTTVLIDYCSLVQTLYLTENGTYTVGNTGYIPGHSSYGEISWDVTDEFVKQVSPTGIGTDGVTNSYTSDNLNISLEDSGGVLHYRLLLEPGTTSGPITVTDTLPSGTTLVADSVTLKGHVTDSLAFDIPSEYLSVTTSGQTITFTIAEEAYQDVAYYHRLALYYDVSVADDPAWNDPNTDSVTYTNSAQWKDQITLSTTVSREVSKLEKYSEQLPVYDEEGNIQQDANGNPLYSDVVRYQILVNPYGEDLLPDSDALTLEDVLSAPDHLNGELLLDTIAVYHYDPSAEGNLGAQLDPDTYSVLYDSNTYTITFTLPDATACVVMYDYSFDRSHAAEAVPISNTATLNGVAHGSALDEITIETETSSASANKATITIYKVDSENYATLLPGARFKLERYVDLGDGNYAWSQTSITGDNTTGEFIADENGRIVLNFLPETEGGGSLYNTLYRLQETKAPTGYQKSDHFYYFVWMEQNATEETTLAAMANQNIFGSGEGQVDPDDVIFIAYSMSDVEYVPNTAVKLTVEKQWQDAQGADISSQPDLPESITVHLYQYRLGAREEAIQYDTVTLTAADTWRYTWTALPAEDTDGTPFLYYVQEEEMEGFVASYSSNNEAGVLNGTITITNTEDQVYLLPETGGRGTGAIYLAGAALSGGSLGLFLWNRYRRRTASKKAS